jgi:hypothetical protein
MGYHELSRRVNKMKNKNKNHISLIKVIKSPTKPKMSFDLNMIQRFFILFVGIPERTAEQIR